MSATPERVDELLSAARQVMERGSYAPYSKFNVGAAVLADGEVFAGANIENASYPLSVCAERNAVAAAVNAGKRSIDAVAVVTRADEPTPPCGGCRQVLNEFGPRMLVVTEAGGERATWTLPEILPHAFGPDDLNPGDSGGSRSERAGVRGRSRAEGERSPRGQAGASGSPPEG